jgi:hypothetical protein
VIQKVYTFSDLLDIHELMTIKAENERRAEEWAKQNAGQG